jgi:hypothetical protein
MKRLFWLIGLSSMVLSAGCPYDIVTTPHLKSLAERRIYIEPIQSENPHIGQVLRDVLEKEFIRKNFELGDPNTATVFISGSTFMTMRSKANQTKVAVVGAGSAYSNQAVESISVIAKDKEGQILLTASYDNSKQYTVSKLAKEFGSELAKRLK